MTVLLLWALTPVPARADDPAWHSQGFNLTETVKARRKSYLDACGQTPSCYVAGMEDYAVSAGNRLGRAMGYILPQDYDEIRNACQPRARKEVADGVACWGEKFKEKYGSIASASKALADGKTGDQAFDSIPLSLRPLINSACAGALDVSACRADGIARMAANLQTGSALFANAVVELHWMSLVSGFCDSAMKTKVGKACTPASVAKLFSSTTSSAHLQARGFEKEMGTGTSWIQVLRDPESDLPASALPPSAPVVFDTDAPIPPKPPTAGSASGMDNGSANGTPNPAPSASPKPPGLPPGPPPPNPGNGKGSGNESKGSNGYTSGGGKGQGDQKGNFLGQKNGEGGGIGLNGETPLKRCQRTDQTNAKTAICNVLGDTGLMQSQAALFHSLQSLNGEDVERMIRGLGMKRLYEAYRRTLGTQLKASDKADIASACGGAGMDYLAAQVNALDATPVDPRPNQLTRSPQYSKELQAAGDLVKQFGLKAKQDCNTMYCERLIPCVDLSCRNQEFKTNPQYSADLCAKYEQSCESDKDMVARLFEKYPFLAWGGDWDPEKPLEDPTNLQSAIAISDTKDVAKGGHEQIQARLNQRRELIAANLVNSMKLMCTMSNEDLMDFDGLSEPVAEALRAAGWSDIATCLHKEFSDHKMTKDGLKEFGKQGAMMLGCLVGTVATEGGLGPVCAALFVADAANELDDASTDAAAKASGLANGGKTYSVQQYKAARARYDSAVTNLELNLFMAAAEGIAGAAKGIKSVGQLMDKMALARRLSNPDELDKIVAAMTKAGAPNADAAAVAEFNDELDRVLKAHGQNIPGETPHAPADATVPADTTVPDAKPAGADGTMPSAGAGTDAAGAGKTLPSGEGGGAKSALPTAKTKTNPVTVAEGAGKPSGSSVASSASAVKTEVPVNPGLSAANKKVVGEAEQFVRRGATSEKKALQETLLDWQNSHPGEHPLDAHIDYQAENQRGNALQKMLSKPSVAESWDPDLPAPSAKGPAKPVVETWDLHPERGDTMMQAPGGNSKLAQVVELHDSQGNVTRYYFRPVEEAGGNSNLVAAKAFVGQDLDRTLGTQTMPRGRWARIGGKLGFLSDEAPGIPLTRQVNMNAPGAQIYDETMATIGGSANPHVSDAKVMSFLIGDGDAHLNNFHYDPKTGRVTFFDPDGTFRTHVSDATGRDWLPFGRDLPERYNPSTIERLRALTDAEIDARYGQFLGQDERAALKFRRDWILKDFENRGRPLFPEGAAAKYEPKPLPPKAAPPPPKAPAVETPGSMATTPKNPLGVDPYGATPVKPSPEVMTQPPGVFSDEVKAAVAKDPARSKWIAGQEARGKMGYRMTGEDFNEFARQNPQVGDSFAADGRDLRITAKGKKAFGAGGTIEDYVTVFDGQTGLSRDVPLREFRDPAGAYGGLHPTSMAKRPPLEELEFARAKDRALESAVKKSDQEYRAIVDRNLEEAKAKGIQPGDRIPTPDELAAEEKLALATQQRLRSYGVETAIETLPPHGRFRLKVLPEFSDGNHWITKLARNRKLGDPEIYFRMEDFHAGGARADINGRWLELTPWNIGRTRMADIDIHELHHMAVGQGKNPAMRRISFIDTTNPAAKTQPMYKSGIGPNNSVYGGTFAQDEVTAYGKNYKVASLRNQQRLRGYAARLAKITDPAEAKALEREIQDFGEWSSHDLGNWADASTNFDVVSRQTVDEVAQNRGKMLPCPGSGPRLCYYSLDGNLPAAGSEYRGIQFTTTASDPAGQYAQLMAQLRDNAKTTDTLRDFIRKDSKAMKAGVDDLLAKARAKAGE